MEDNIIIELNALQCDECKDVLMSLTRHDYKTCSCGKCMVDGGVDYLRRNVADYTDYTISRKYIDYEATQDLTDEECYDNILILMDAFEDWVKFYNLVDVNTEKLNQRFIDRYIPTIRLMAGKLKGVDKNAC